MDRTVNIRFNVTPAQKETIDSRVSENGFTDISEYLKVVSLKTGSFNVTPAGASAEEASVELGFKVTESEKVKLEDKAKESGAETLADYLLYIALHAVVSAVVEIRSTGSFDSMVARIAAAKNK